MKFRKYIIYFLSITIFIITFILIFLHKNPIYNIQFGSNYNGQSISGQLKYIFKLKGINNTQDIINNIYFQGDTLCFKFNTYNLNNKKIKIYFQNPKDSKKFQAERIDIQKNSCRGFSLIGTLLEEFRINYFKKSWIKFNLVILYKNRGKTITKIQSNKFFIDIEMDNPSQHK